MSHLGNGANTDNLPTGLLGELNESIHVNLSEQCLAHCEDPINVNMCSCCCCYCCIIIIVIIIITKFLYLLSQKWPYSKCCSV